jgi:hypothetical protein
MGVAEGVESRVVDEFLNPIHLFYSIHFDCASHELQNVPLILLVKEFPRGTNSKPAWLYPNSSDMSRKISDDIVPDICMSR